MTVTVVPLPTGPLGATTAMALATAQAPVVAGYEIGEALGRGGMGVVYRARETATGREVAIKWLAARAAETLRLRFEREARAVASVRHPNIVSVLAAGSTVEGSYIVMELVDGFSLATALDAKALGKNALVDIVVKVARGLAAAHAASVVHRDVKPDNIVVDARGEPRLLDFGLARFLDAAGALTDKNAVLGTLGYMAPEVFAGGGAEAGPACDVYALGAILYEGLAGSPPFGTGDAKGVMARMESGKIDPLPADVDPRLAALSMAALEAEPARRPTASALADELAAVGRATPESPETPPPPARRSLAPLLAVGVLGSVVGGIIVALALRDTPRADEHTAGAVAGAGAVFEARHLGEAEARHPDEAMTSAGPDMDEDSLPIPLPIAAPVADPIPAPDALPDPMAGPPAETPPPVARAPEPAPPQAAPSPSPPAPRASPDPAKPEKLTVAQLVELQIQAAGALASNDRAKADEISRRAIANAPEGQEKLLAPFHVALGRDALVDLKTGEAEREYVRGLAGDPKNKHALLGLVAVALLEGKVDAAKKHLHALESLGASGPLEAARLLATVARHEPGFRYALLQAQGSKTDNLLVKTVAKELNAREQVRRK